MQDMTLEQFAAPIWLSLKVSVLASVMVFLLGLAAAWGMTRSRRRWWAPVTETVFLLPLVLPPTVVGFVLLTAIGRHSWVGRLAERVLDQPILFTWWAAVMASVVVAFPLVYQSLKAGFSSVERELQDAARSMGAGEWQVLVYITLPLAWRSLVTAYVLGFARGLGEFGATLMVAGNIPGRTQTLPTAIYFAVDSGRTALAWGWTGATVAVSFVLLLLMQRVKVK